MITFGYAREYAELDAAHAYHAPAFVEPLHVTLPEVETAAHALTEARYARMRAKRTVEPFRSYHIATARGLIWLARAMNSASTFRDAVGEEA